MNVERLGRIPYASVIGFLLVFSGTAIFCGTGFEALKRIDKLFNDLFYPLYEITELQIMVIITGAGSFLIAVIIIIFSCLTTGDTREKVYKSTNNNRGGKVAHYVLILINYVLIAVWLLLFCAWMVPLASWSAYSYICIEENEYWRSIHESKDNEKFTYTFNLTHYGLYRFDRQAHIPADSNEVIDTATGFSVFCSSVMSIGSLVISCMCAIIAVVIGLIHMMGALASNLTRLKLMQELMSYRNLVADESDNRDDWRFVSHQEPSKEFSRLLSPTMGGSSVGLPRM